MTDVMKDQAFLDGLTKEDIENMGRAWLLGVTCVPENLVTEIDRETLMEQYSRRRFYEGD